MGKRGPGKTPTATLKARGTFRADSHRDDVDSQLENKVPPPPKHFDEAQKALWQKYGEKLASKGLLTELDAMAFELPVGSYTGMLETIEQLADEELVFITDSGSAVANPLVGITGKHIALLKWTLPNVGATQFVERGRRAKSRPANEICGNWPHIRASSARFTADH